MGSETIIDAIKMGIEYILIVIFIGIAIAIMGLRNEYADSLNEISIATDAAQQQLEFSEYGTDRVYTADEVMAAIRKYRSGDTDIYVDDLGYGTALLLNEDNAKKHPKRYTIEYLMENMDFTNYYYSYLVYDGADVKKANSNGKGTTVTAISFKKVSD